MLHLYVSNDGAIPEGMMVVRNNEEYFDTVTINKLDTSMNGVLNNTDKATYLDINRFIDRFGTALYWNDLSTGGKTVLNVFYNPDICFDTFECGVNALTDLKNLKHGHVYRNRLRNEDNIDNIDVIVNDDGCRRYFSYAEYSEEEM